MSGEKYANKAVVNLLSYYENNLQTYLTAVETAEGLSAGSLTPPRDYKPTFVPNDMETPILQAYCMSGTPIDHRNQLYIYNCVVAVNHVGDADIEAGQLFVRRYMTALVDCLAADRTLGETVVEALDGEQSFDFESESETFFQCALDITIITYEG